MTAVFVDRVKESTSTVGTGNLALAGALTGYQAFSAVGDGNSCYYCVYAVDSNGNPTGDWETNVGVYTLSGTTLARTNPPLASSNGGALVSFGSGTKHVILTIPANIAVGYTQTSAQANVNWNVELLSSALPVVSDGTAISTWNDSSGNAINFTQGTSGNRPVYKTSGNGINGVPVVRFTSSSDQFLRSTTGGLALANTFYAYIIFRPSTNPGNWQEIFCWGNESNGERRALQISPGGLIAWVGGYADIVTSTGVTSGTAYLIEVIRNVSGNITIYLNGSQIGTGSPSYAAYTSDTITIGQNNINSNQEPFNGDVAELRLYAGNPNPLQRSLLLTHASTTYGLTVTNSPPSTAIGKRTTYDSKILTDSSLSDDGTNTYCNEPLIIGGQVVLKSGEGASSGFTIPALLSVYGNIVAVSSGGTGSGEHMFGVSTQDNVIAVWNALGFSAIRFLLNSGMAEGGAFGWAPPGAGPWGGQYGSTYWEASNFADPAHAGSARLVQTGVIAGQNGYFLRWEYKTDGSCVFYNVNTYPTQVPILTIYANGDVALGNAALATNATSGFLGIPTCAGTPTGTPSSYTGSVPIVYDTTGHKLWIYDGAWKSSQFS